MEKIAIKQLDYIKDEYSAPTYHKNKKPEYECGELVLNIKGLPYQILAPLRKVAMEDIPCYAFPSEKINITVDKSVYDRTYMKNHLSQLPIPNMDKYMEKKIMSLSPDYYKHIDFQDPKRPKHPNDKLEIEYFIKGINTGDTDEKYITTNDIRIMINNNDVEDLYNKEHPFTIIKLRAGDEFECSMKAVLATGKCHGIFSASNCYYKKKSELEYDFTVRSYWQHREYDILIQSCDILLEKLEIIKSNYKNEQYQNKDSYNEKTNTQVLIINDDDYTCINAINYFLQSDKNIVFAGINRPNFIEDKTECKFRGKDNIDLSKVFINAIDESIETYKTIKKQLIKLNK